MDNEELRPKSRRSAKRRKAQRKKKLLAALGAIVVILLLSLIILAVKSYSADTTLIGTYRFDDTTVYEFDGKGKGSLHTSLNKYAFSYSSEGSTLRIDFESSAVTDTEYQYSIQGGILTLERGGEMFRLKKDPRQ